MIELLANAKDELIDLCKEHNVLSISVFGSAVNGVFSEDSDLDLLVHFSEEIDVLDYSDNYFSLLEKLQSLTGKKVDLVSVNSLRNPILKEEIEKSKVKLYAA